VVRGIKKLAETSKINSHRWMAD